MRIIRITKILGAIAIVCLITFLSISNSEQVRQIQDMEKSLNGLTSVIKRQSEVLQQKSAEIEELESQVERLRKMDSANYIKQVVISEAGGGTFENQCAVLQTMVDRAYLWNESIIDIVQQQGQYAAPATGNIPNGIELAFDTILVDGGKVFDENVTHFATYKPYWAEYKEYRGYIDGHYFWG